METNDKFVEASKRERFCLSHILPTLKNNSKYEWTEYITDIHSYDIYDCLLQAYIDGTIKKRFIIEVKVRDTHYGELILETKKLRDLKSKVYDDLTDILYINITPNGTYIFNITKMEKEGKLMVNKLKANKATMESRAHKVMKSIIYLDVDNATKYIDYKFNENEYKQSQVKIIKDNNKHKNTKCLFEYLIKNDGDN